MTAEIVKSTNLPVTVKTRLGWDESTKYIVEVAERLQDVGIKAISIHGRTRKQMYKGVANWELIRDVKNNPRMHIPVFGNGDVNCPKSAKEKKENYKTQFSNNKYKWKFLQNFANKPKQSLSNYMTTAGKNYSSPN